MKIPDPGLEVNKNVFSSIPYVPGLSEEFIRIFQHPSIEVSKLQRSQHPKIYL